jgi:hypothetical protein
MNIKLLVEKQLSIYATSSPAKRKLDRSKKFCLGERLGVARILIGRFLENSDCRAMVNYKNNVITTKAIEDYLDHELLNFYDEKSNGYDLEELIVVYQYYTPKLVLNLSQCAKCGYNDPFCPC